jgi:ribonucleoside-triphosphate reductase
MTHLQRVKTVYENWVLPGSTQTRVEGLTHNVSNTCTVKEDEWNDVASFIWDHRESLRGVALLGYVADHLYDMAPYQTVVEGHDSEKTWNDLASIDWEGVNLFVEGEGENPVLDPACSGGECTLSF